MFVAEIRKRDVHTRLQPVHLVEDERLGAQQ